MESAPGTPALVSLPDIRQAADRIRSFVRETPLVEIDAVDRGEGAGGPVLLKCENLQRGGAFKMRGAFNMLMRLSPEERRRGVITYSSGNHGRALALAAGFHGIDAVVVMPTTAPALKVDAVRALGARAILAGTTILERQAAAEAEAAARGLTLVPPFDHPWIIEGQGTVGLEILARRPDATAIYVPVGGGGLIAGVAGAAKQSAASIRIVGVEPAGAAKMTAARKAGHPVTLPSTSSLADGLLAVRPGDLTFAHVEAFVDEIVTVAEQEIVDAMLWLFERARLVVEPSGAVSLAGALRDLKARAGAGIPATGPVAAVLSGGNISPDAYARCLNMAGAGRRDG